MRPLHWMLRIAQLAFGCHHSRLRGPFTIKKRTYQICVECGREFPYSWELMHSVRSDGENAHPNLSGVRNAATH